MCDVIPGAIKYMPAFANGRGLATNVLRYGVAERDRAPSGAQEVDGVNDLLRRKPGLKELQGRRRGILDEGSNPLRRRQQSSA